MRSIAKIFHENVQVVNDAVVEAYNKHKENAQDMIKYVREYMVQRATNFKCEDVLSADVRITFQIQLFQIINSYKYKVCNRTELNWFWNKMVANDQLMKLNFIKKIQFNSYNHLSSFFTAM